MEAVQRQLLYCLSAYKRGERQAESAGLADEDWERLYLAAAIHKMQAMVFETMWNVPGFCGGHRELLLRWRRETLMQLAGQTARSRRIVEISAILREQGIAHGVVKGVVCRELYSRPDLRPSGDEDVYIRAEDRDRCGDILKENGLTLSQGDEAVDHWHDGPSGLHIELHTSLTAGGRREDEKLENYFRQQLDHAVTVEVSGGAVSTLPPTAHFVFLVCHALKHFITGGFGIRTLCDVAAFLERYHRDIDLTTAQALVEEIHARDFLDQLIAIGQEWFAMDPAQWGWEYRKKPDPEELLLDCLEAGVYGQSSLSRKHSAGMTMQAAEDDKSRPGLMNTLFPPRSGMEGRYPVLKKHPALLPACWLHRMVKYAGEVGRSRGKENSPVESVSLGKKRTEMMVKYGVFPKSKKKN